MKKLKELLDMYLKHCQKYNSNGTYLYYRKNFKIVTKYFESMNIITDDDIKETFFEDFTDYLKENTNKKNSKINDVISSVITVFNFNNVEYPKRFKLRDDTVSYKVINEKALLEIGNYLNKLDYKKQNNLTWILSVLIPLDTGCRLTEMLEIKTENINLENNCIYLEHTKNNKNRYVYFGELSKKYISIACKKKKTNILWNYIVDCKTSYSGVYKFYKRMNNFLKSDNQVAPHRLRKTFATELLKMGCPLTSISKLLGHSNVKQTMVYLEIDHILISNDYKKYYPYKKDL